LKAFEYCVLVVVVLVADDVPVDVAKKVEEEVVEAAMLVEVETWIEVEIGAIAVVVVLVGVRTGMEVDERVGVGVVAEVVAAVVEDGLVMAYPAIAATTNTSTTAPMTTEVEMPL